MLVKFKLNSFYRILKFNFKKRKNNWKPDRIILDKNQEDIVHPDEIRKIVRNFQVKKEKFSESIFFKSWKTSFQAISVFQKFLNKNSNCHKNIEIFEEIKIFLENVSVSPFSPDDRLFYEHFCLILNRIFSEYSNSKEIN